VCPSSFIDRCRVRRIPHALHESKALKHGHCRVEPRQLAPTVRTTGSGFTGSPAPSSSSTMARLHRALFCIGRGRLRQRLHGGGSQQTQQSVRSHAGSYASTQRTLQKFYMDLCCNSFPRCSVWFTLTWDSRRGISRWFRFGLIRINEGSSQVNAGSNKFYHTEESLKQCMFPLD
jgi:hypothetical protein